MATKDKTFDLNVARQEAATLVAYLAMATHRIEIAGSIRRQVHQVHDIDLVAWAKCDKTVTTDLFGAELVIWGGPDALVRKLQAVAKLENVSPDAKILRLEYSGIPVEIYLTEPDGSNFEALWQMRTGSAAHNAWLAQRAQKLHLYYKAGYGIFTLGEDRKFSKRVDDGTEAGIFTALDLPYREPAQRF